MKALLYFDKANKIGQSVVIVRRVRPGNRIYEVVTITSMRTYPKSPKGLVLNSTRTVQYFTVKENAHKEYERQLGRLQYGGWVIKINGKLRSMQRT